MGTDEHGEAYPEIRTVGGVPYEHYRCPICKGDENRFYSCEHPGCFDGRDYLHPLAVARRREQCRSMASSARAAPTQIDEATTHPIVGCIVATLIVVALVFVMLLPRSAPAMDHGFDPNNATVRYMESLQRPNMPGSCCGKGDGYPVEDYWPNPDGSWTAKIGDGSGITYPDGTTRNYIGTGTEVIVPKEVVNPWDDDLNNPTDVSWIFMTVHAAEVGTIYCLIRHPSDN